MSDMRDTQAKQYDAVVSGLRDEPCAFKRQCFRDGWDAAIAALPDMVLPLVWEVDERYPDEARAGNYDIWNEWHGHQLYFWSIVEGSPHPTLEAAKAAAQAHHTAAILSAFGVQGGEA